MSGTSGSARLYAEENLSSLLRKYLMSQHSRGSKSNPLTTSTKQQPRQLTTTKQPTETTPPPTNLRHPTVKNSRSPEAGGSTKQRRRPPPPPTRTFKSSGRRAETGGDETRRDKGKPVSRRYIGKSASLFAIVISSLACPSHHLNLGRRAATFVTTTNQPSSATPGKTGRTAAHASSHHGYTTDLRP